MATIDSLSSMLNLTYDQVERLPMSIALWKLTWERSKSEYEERLAEVLRTRKK